jgi:Recombination endonuclease VII
MSATKRCSRCGSNLPTSQFAVRRASADGLQAYCRTCVSTWARQHRPRKLRNAPAGVEAGEKWCRRCDEVKPQAAFARNRTAPDGLQGQCRACAAAAYRAKREAAGALMPPADVPSGHKFCRTCREIKPLSMWSKNARATDGLQTRCKSCVSAVGRRDHLARTYGLSVDDIDRMLAAQHGLCAICRTAPAIHVDHDHRTGFVRGMLCFRCNAALGQFDDDPLVLRRAARYLERSASAEPPTTRPTWHGAPAEPSRLERRLRERLAEVDLGTAS